MEYQNTINFLADTANQPSKFRTKTELKYLVANMERVSTIVILHLKF